MGPLKLKQMLQFALSPTFDQDGDIAVLSQEALLIKGSQNRGPKVRDLHMEQLGHVGHRGGGR